MTAAEKRAAELAARVCRRCVHYWTDLDDVAPEHLCTRQRRDDVDPVVGVVRSGPLLDCVDERGSNHSATACGRDGRHFEQHPLPDGPTGWEEKHNA